MKRVPMPRRAHPLGWGKPRKELPKVNVGAARKRDARRAAGHRAFLRSQAREDVDARAGGQCEFVQPIPPTGVLAPLLYLRCPETEGLEYHHDRYPSRPELVTAAMIRKLCKGHHHLVERTEHPTRRNGRLPS